jgi:hypothetical protein
VYTVLLRQQPDRDPIVLAAATCWWGLVFLLPWLAGEILLGNARFDVDGEAVGGLVYLGLAASAVTCSCGRTERAECRPPPPESSPPRSRPWGTCVPSSPVKPGSRAKIMGSILALLGAAIAARAGSPMKPPEPQDIRNPEPAAGHVTLDRWLKNSGTATRTSGHRMEGQLTR